VKLELENREFSDLIWGPVALVALAVAFFFIYSCDQWNHIPEKMQQSSQTEPKEQK